MAAGVVAARVVVRDDDVQVVRLELVGWIHHILQVDVYCLHDWEALGCFMESRSLLSQGSLRSPWVSILRAYSPYGCPRAHYVHPGLTYFGLTALMDYLSFFLVRIILFFLGQRYNMGKPLSRVF